MPRLRFKESDYFPHQYDFLTSKKPIKGLVGGFGSGKTFVFLKNTLKCLFEKTNNTGKSAGLIIYPTYDLADELFVTPFMEMLDKIGLPYKYNQSKHRFHTAAGDIKIYQLQKPQRIIGAEYTFVGFDEYRFKGEKLWLFRLLQDMEIYLVVTLYL